MWSFILILSNIIQKCYAKYVGWWNDVRTCNICARPVSSRSSVLIFSFFSLRKNLFYNEYVHCKCILRLHMQGSREESLFENSGRWMIIQLISKNQWGGLWIHIYCKIISIRLSSDQVLSWIRKNCTWKCYHFEMIFFLLISRSNLLLFNEIIPLEIQHDWISCTPAKYAINIQSQ